MEKVLSTRRQRADSMREIIQDLANNGVAVPSAAIFHILDQAEAATPTCPFCSAIRLPVDINSKNIALACEKHKKLEKALVEEELA